MNIKGLSSSGMLPGKISLFNNGLLKSTTQKLERQAERDSQVAFFENQKQNLKNIECSSPEEAGRILELLHSYEDQIAAVKAAYNNAQMFHLMDEAMEKGEQMAKAIEKSEPKTAEERRQEAMEDALGIDEEKGLLSEILDKITEEALIGALENIPNETLAKDMEDVPNEALTEDTKNRPDEILAEAIADTPMEAPAKVEETPSYKETDVIPASYKKFDAFI